MGELLSGAEGIAPYDPTFREKAKMYLSEVLGLSPRVASGIMGSEMDPNQGIAGMGLADFVPGMNAGMGLQEGRRALDQGRNVDAALAGGSAMLDAIPVVGGAAKMAGKKVGPEVARLLTEESGAVGKKVAADAPFDEMGMGGRMGIGANGGPAIDPYASVDMPPHMDPRHTGKAPNRTTPYPRYEPKKSPPRMERLLGKIANQGDPIRHTFDKYIAKGKELKGPDWYNTEELRDWFVNGLGEAEGDKQWREYMELIGTTSTGAKVPWNIRAASFYRALEPGDRTAVAQLVKDKGMTPHDAAASLGVKVPDLPENPAYGHVKQRNQAGNVLNREAGNWAREVPEGLTAAQRTKWLQANPKVKGFGNDLMGDETNIAADMHFMRMLAMSDGGADFLTDQLPATKEGLEAARKAIGPRKVKEYTVTRDVKGKPVTSINLKKAAADGAIKDTEAFKAIPSAWADTPAPTEYAAYEKMANEVAAQYGMTPAQFQASLWMGAGDMTNLADESQGTFMELFRNALDKRAGERSISRKEMLKEFIENKAPLSVLLGLPALPSGEDDSQTMGGILGGT